MTRLLFLLMSSLLVSQFSYAQINNPVYNNPNYNNAPLIINNNQAFEINAAPYTITIQTKALYNATPDGYLVTYTKSFISQTTEGVEQKMNNETDKLIDAVQRKDIQKGKILVDVVALDPIFELTIRDTAVVQPSGYKITENITFNVGDIDDIRRLSQTCLEYEFYDLLKVQAYLDNAQPILDTLDAKLVELLDAKKQLSENVGWSFGGGVTSFQERKEVFYPNERYLFALAQNRDAIYQHQLSQNTTVQYNRQLSHNTHYNYNHKHADFVFNEQANEPVIQFYAELYYTYTKKNPEEERQKEEEAEGGKDNNVFYMIKDDGTIKRINLEE